MAAEDGAPPQHLTYFASIAQRARYFGLFAAGRGEVDLLSVSFPSFTNTRTVTAGTLTLHYWNEFNSPTGYSLAASIDESIDVIFAPPDQIPEMAALVDEAQENDGESDEDTPDPPEPIENGIIDLGRLATDALYLAINPYPRKPDAILRLWLKPPIPRTTPLPR